MQKFKNLFFLLIFSILANCCALHGKQNETAFEGGKIYPHVPCKSDTLLSYTLCLPPDFQSGKLYPLIVFFDSHGNGLLPVDLFKEIAGKYGFIVAGSNNSKNGLTTEETSYIYKKLFDDVTSRFTIEKKAVYLAGFSGGARVACSIALSGNEIAGVVGCGAGMPQLSQKPVNNFSFLGVGGRLDFNLNELRISDNMLEQAGFVHHLIEFDGKHEWPPAGDIQGIITWIDFDAMRQGAIPSDRKKINAFIETNSQQADSLAKTGNFYEQQLLYLKMLHYLQGLTDIAPLQVEISRLASEKQVRENMSRLDELTKLEHRLQAEYAGELQQKSPEWWANSAAVLHEKAKNLPDAAMRELHQRVLGYLSLNCYMLSTGLLKQNNFEAASAFIEIYRLVDPENAEHRYLAATVAARKGNQAEALTQLEKAIGLGFNDLARLKADKDFESLHSNNRFEAIIRLMR